MLNINIEFRKGILFVRLTGELTKRTVLKLKNEVTNLIKDNGIRNVVFNLTDLSALDLSGISHLYYNYELCQNNHGQSLMCGGENLLIKDRLIKSHLPLYMLEISDELKAFQIIKT